MDQFVELARLINKDLEPDQESMMMPSMDIDLNILREKLSLVIGYMLENQFEKLCNAMYRLDVSEKKFHEVLTGKDPEEVVPSLADLVIEREMQKIKTRILYKNKKL